MTNKYDKSFEDSSKPLLFTANFFNNLLTWEHRIMRYGTGTSEPPFALF